MARGRQLSSTSKSLQRAAKLSKVCGLAQTAAAVCALQFIPLGGTRFRADSISVALGVDRLPDSCAARRSGAKPEQAELDR